MPRFVSVFLIGQMMVQMDYLHGYDSAFIILCYGYHCSYTYLCDILAFSVMIWQS